MAQKFKKVKSDFLLSFNKYNKEGYDLYTHDMMNEFNEMRQWI